MEKNDVKQITKIAVKVGVIIVLFVFFFIYLTDIFSFISSALTILTPVILGIVFAYFLNHPMLALEKNIIKIQFFQKNKRARALSLTLTLLITVSILLLIIIVIIPQIVETVNTISPKLPQLFEDTSSGIRDFMNGIGIKDFKMPDLPKVLETLFSEFFISVEQTANQLFSLISGVFNVLYVFFMGLLLSVYLLIDREKIIQYLNKLIKILLPKRAGNMALVILGKANNVVGSYLSTKLITSLVLGALLFIACTIFGIPYALLCSVIMSFFNLIPLFGSIAGGIITVILIFINDPMLALVYFIILEILIQLEGNVFWPKLMANKAGMPTLLVLLGVIVGGGFFGIIGMIVGPPLAVIIYDALNIIMESRKAKRKRIRPIE